jgi:hypothetical protein
LFAGRLAALIVISGLMVLMNFQLFAQSEGNVPLYLDPK